MQKGMLPQDSPAARLLEMLGPVNHYNQDEDEQERLGDFGKPTRTFMEHMLEPAAKGGVGSRIGPLEKVHAFWFAGMSCDGCTITVSGASSPSVESLLLGAHPGIPRVILHHPVVNIESGPNYFYAHEAAVKGELDSPYVIILEGSVSDETRAHPQGGYWSGQGEEPGVRTASTAPSAPTSGSLGSHPAPPRRSRSGPAPPGVGFPQPRVTPPAR
ncbi:MAG: hypothetical protein M3133_09270 [Actinomycetota bacterium]|nr:hypothetical protein [Actinomycetota bacterium]